MAYLFYFDVMRGFSYNANTSTYTNETDDMQDGIVNGVKLVPIQISQKNDALYIGADHIFRSVYVDVSTAGVYSNVTLQWQYYNGSWTEVTGLSDATNGFKNAGANFVDFVFPTDWVKNTVNGFNHYWLRCIVTDAAGATLTTAPLSGRLDVCLWIPRNPRRFRHRKSAYTKDINLPGNPFIISYGNKATTLLVEGKVSESGVALEVLYQRYCNPLLENIHKLTWLDYDNTMYDGTWIVDDFEYQETGGHVRSFKYKLKLKKGGTHLVM